ncbi:MAG TPA: cellulose binding domain-containing protein [Trebonia sp.]|nr:cellulose binding domain-containing protein [Trebonia sp.]
MSRSRRRQGRGRVLLWISPLAVAVAVAAVVITLPKQGPLTVRTEADSASPLTAAYQTVTGWGTGYTGQYTITNPGTTAAAGWTLAFRLPAGTSVSSLWDGAYTDDAGQVTVTSDGWDATVAPGASVTVGFVTASAGQAGQPADCLINGASCQAGGSAAPSPSASASSSPPATPAPSASASSPSASPSATPSKSPTATPSPSTSPSASSGAPSAGTAGFAPYVDTSLYPPFNLVSTAQATGVKQFNLAFVVAGGGGCTPEWGGVTVVGADPVASQIAALRAIGGDVRISFGGEDGSELAQTCTSLSALEAAYQDVISGYDVNKIDFDIEGAAVDDTAANALRDQALVALQKQDPGLQVSFTLPVLPSGLPADEDAVLTGAAQAGVDIAAVNVMAMDYGDGAAPNPSGQMGTFAIDAATATDAQVASALGISDAAAWSKVAVTPMIGVNDTSDEIFTVANAQQLAAFAAGKHLAWLSMWSAGRDQECPGGAAGFAEPTCSSVVQTPDAFMDAFGAY